MSDSYHTKEDICGYRHTAPMANVVILDAGLIRFHLSKVLLPITNLYQIYNRTEKNTVELSESRHADFTKDLLKIKKKGLFLIYISNKGIEEISCFILFEGTLVAYTSGNTPMDILKVKYCKGIFYPLKTFSRKGNIAYDQIRFLIEIEEEKDFTLLQNITEKIPGTYHAENFFKRAQIHLPAIWVCNFVNHLYYISQEFCEQAQVPFQIVNPLISKTAEKIPVLNFLPSAKRLVHQDGSNTSWITPRQTRTRRYLSTHQ